MALHVILDNYSARAVGQEVIDRLQPFGIDAALAAMETQGQEHCDKRQQVENALRQAHYEAGRARRQIAADSALPYSIA